MLDISSIMTHDGAAAFFGMVGATLLMVNHPRYSKWGWVAYLVSNGCWLIYANATQQESLKLQTLYFTFTTLVGIWTWIVWPALKRVRSRVTP